MSLRRSSELVDEQLLVLEEIDGRGNPRKRVEKMHNGKTFLIRAATRVSAPVRKRALHSFISYCAQLKEAGCAMLLTLRIADR